MVDLSGHEAGNGGYSQRKPTAHRVSSTRKFATACGCEFADRKKRTCPGIACRNRWAMVVSMVGSAASDAAAGALSSGTAAVVLWASHVAGPTIAASARMPGYDVHALTPQQILCAAPCSRASVLWSLGPPAAAEPKPTHPTTSQVLGTGDGLAVSGRQPRVHGGPGFPLAPIVTSTPKPKRAPIKAWRPLPLRRHIPPYPSPGRDIGCRAELELDRSSG